jgi:hypothetical protein
VLRWRDREGRSHVQRLLLTTRHWGCSRRMRRGAIEWTLQ